MLNPGQKRNMSVAAVLSQPCKRAKKEATISKGPEVTSPSPNGANSRHGPFDTTECNNAVLENPERRHLEKSMALVAVYEGVLETLDGVGREIQKLEKMMADAYTLECAGGDDYAEAKEAGSE
ncbi:hypothetical protein PENVUL_c009G07175 [Penicillium vulpinum]|uniref:Uncharacterized protein n=2 Tax=Penicillium vulpinum TaxID=29845 RepID=A0A1V6S3D1_9EURO|nr:hypothetical protein PENVUL_c009G07175 [Penicillium vulpinum]